MPVGRADGAGPGPTVVSMAGTFLSPSYLPGLGSAAASHEKGPAEAEPFLSYEGGAYGSSVPINCAAPLVSTAKIERCAPAGIADDVSAASCCCAAVLFCNGAASCDGVAVMSVVKFQPPAGTPAAKPIAAGKPPGSGERKYCPPLTLPLAAGPLVEVESEKPKSCGMDAGAGLDES